MEDQGFPAFIIFWNQIPPNIKTSNILPKLKTVMSQERHYKVV